jgi:flagellar hook-basal body complex protein FliE
MDKMWSLQPFEMAATRPGHIGYSERAARKGGAKAQEKTQGSTGAGSFASSLVGALEYVNGKQLAEKNIAQQLIVAPDTVDIHDVTVAMAEAGMSLEAANRIISQMITSWNEVTTTR